MYYYGHMPYQNQPYYQNNSVSIFAIILVVFLLLIIVGCFYNGRGFGLC